jgi:hypothetical protein
MPPAAIDPVLRESLGHAAGDGITLGDLLGRLDRGGFCFVAFILAMPFIQPVSLGPLTMLGGATFVALGWQLGRGRACPALPGAAHNLRIHGKAWVTALDGAVRLLGFCRRFTRPRHQNWVAGTRGERLVGWLILSGGILLAIPMASLPLSNTLPALMIACACIGWLEHDGLMVLASLAWGALTLLYIAAVLACLAFFGDHCLAWLSGFLPF